MTNFEDIFDIALTRLLAGETIEQIVKDYPDHATELISLLSVAQTGLHIPKLNPPTPFKRRLYEEKVTKLSWLVEKLWLSRVAIVPIALVVAFLGGRAVVSATESSLPGDTLYSLKRATESTRLTFTRDPEKVANLHVELMQKRVNEVRQAADSGNETTETKAIEELQSQTSKTFAEVATVATANALSKQDSTLLDTLVAVNKEQKNVLEDLSTTEENQDTKIVASTALEDTKKNDQTLAKIIATVNEQALIDLPNKISITGVITFHYGARITVEKNTFTIDDKTTITGLNNELLNKDVTLTGRASIVGQKVDGILFAKQIVLLPEDRGEVKGEVTPTTPVVKPVPTTTPNPTPTTPPAEPIQPQTPTKASGSYITEPANQDYTF